MQNAQIDNLPLNGAVEAFVLFGKGVTSSVFTPFTVFRMVTFTKFTLDAVDVVGCVVVGFASLLAVVVATAPSITIGVALAAELVVANGFASADSLNGFDSDASPLNPLQLSLFSALSPFNASSALTHFASIDSFSLVLSASGDLVAVESVSFMSLVVDAE